MRMNDPYVRISFETTRTNADELLEVLNGYALPYSPAGIAMSELIKALKHPDSEPNMDRSRREQMLENCRQALTKIRGKQLVALEIIREHEFVFERPNIGNEPGNWSHLAFTLYSMLCEIESIAGGALSDE